MKYSSKFWQFLVATSHVSTLRDMNKWNKNCRFGGVGKMVNGMPFAHRMPVWSYASSTPKMCFFWRTGAGAGHDLFAPPGASMWLPGCSPTLIDASSHPHFHHDSHEYYFLTYKHWIKDERRRFKPKCVMVSHTHTHRQTHTHTVNHETVSLP